MEVTDKLIKEMPDVQENAIAQLAEEQEQEHAGLVDRMGRAFSRTMHLTDENDKPKLTKRGQLKIKRGQGPDAKAKESKIGGIEPTGLGFAQSQAHAEAEILVTGQSAASLTFLLGMVIFKDDGKPTQDEINQVTYAYQTYFRAKNIRDLPPGIVLATALVTYAAPRMMKPRMQKKTSDLWKNFRIWRSKTKGAPESDVAGRSDADKG